MTPGSILGRGIHVREPFDAGSSDVNSARAGVAPEDAGFVVSTGLERGDGADS